MKHPRSYDIRVTAPLFPERQEIGRYLDEIWDRQWLTNDGPLARELESSVRAWLDVPYLQYVSSGTAALQVALATLGVRGSIITTPFSHVATCHSILWAGCRPIFVDIDADSFCIDPARIEEKITPDVTAILATHVYGMPCDVEAIGRIASKHGLKVIYDAAHAFGVKLDGESLLNRGDAAALSFHATKIFHTVEGGAVVTHSEADDDRAALMKAFGVRGQEILCAGLNAKPSELHAAVGLCNLPLAAAQIEKRKQRFAQYRERLSGLPLTMIDPGSVRGLEWNYAYFPIFLDSERTALRVQEALSDEGIEARQYFRPALNRLGHVDGDPCPIAEDLSERVLCLPFGPWLTEAQIDRISRLIRGLLGGST